MQIYLESLENDQVPKFFISFCICYWNKYVIQTLDVNFFSPIFWYYITVSSHMVIWCYPFPVSLKHNKTLECSFGKFF